MSSEPLFAGSVSTNESFLLVIGVMAFFIIVILIFKGKCPSCRRYRSFKKTGEKRRDGSLIFGTTYYEYRCTQCAFTSWVDDQGSGGGDGDGGGE